MEPAIYHWLIGNGYSPALPTHLFACTVSERCDEFGAPLPELLGLSEASLALLAGRHFPTAAAIWDGQGCLRRLARQQAGLPSESFGGDPPLDLDLEDDLRALLLEHRSTGAAEEEWFAAIVARACARPNHLWQDLGLTGRDDLNRLLRTYFAPLHAKNVGDMKWKKFFYRQLCEREGLVACRSPVCTACDDHALCFGPEA